MNMIHRKGVILNEEVKPEKSEKTKRQRRLIEEHLRKEMSEEEIEALSIILKVNKKDTEKQ